MMSSRDRCLSIHQQNVNKSLIAQSDFLNQLNPDIYDFTAIQEPYLDSNHNSRATPNWYTVYPKEHYITPSRTRTIILVNKRLATDTWAQVDMGSPDVTALVVNTGRGKVWLVNMYNDIGWHQGLERSIQAFQKRAHATQQDTWS